MVPDMRQMDRFQKMMRAGHDPARGIPGKEMCIGAVMSSVMRPLNRNQRIFRASMIHSSPAIRVVREDGYDDTN